MNRVIKTGILTAITTIALMFASGCSKKDDPTVNLVSGGFDGKVTAKVESGSVVSVYLWIHPVIQDSQLSGTFVEKDSYSNGGFSISLPVISAGNLMSISDFFTTILEVTGEPQYSAPDAQVVDIDFLGIDQDGYMVGYYLYSSADGKTVGYHVYADRDVTVTGGTNITVSLKKGWNRLYKIPDATGAYLNGKITTQAPAGINWYYNGL